MHAVILAATYQRLENPDGKKVPLVLLKLKDDPLLTALVKKLSGVSDLRYIIVVVNETIKPELDEWVKSITPRIVTVRIISDGTKNEREKLGAIGDLIYAIKHAKIKDDLLVIGGDNWFTYDILKFVEQARSRSPAVVVTPYRTRLSSSRFGLVEMNEDNQITKFYEKPSSSNLKLKASCVYFFSASDLKSLDVFSREHNTVCSPGVYFQWLVNEKKESVFGVELEARWYDIGEFRDPNPKGPDFVKIRKMLRNNFSLKNSTWETEATRRLQWVSSHEDLLDCLNDDDPNLRIVVASLLGNMKYLIDPIDVKHVISSLLILLADNSQNEIDYGGFMSDDSEVYFVSACAAKSLVHLGYAEDEQAVFEKARKEGIKVEERRNILS